MDRKLIFVAVLALIIEVTVLLMDLNLLPMKWSAQNSNHRLIGKITFAQDKVKKRSLHSMLWEDSQKDDELRAFDSVLTLNHSSARLELEGDITVNLHENTLVVVEPLDQVSTDNQLRLKFSRGNMRSQTGRQKLRIGSGQWTMEAGKGSDLSLRTVGEDQVEMEVQKGEVHLVHRENGKQESYRSGQRLVIDKSEIKSVETISYDLQWKQPTDERVYTHATAVPYRLQWDGPATTLKILSPPNSVRQVTVNPNAQQMDLTLTLGTHSFTLSDGDKTSQTLSVHVLPAEKIAYFYPLPRDRVVTGETVSFSWRALSGAKSYRLEFSQDESFADTWISHPSTPTTTPFAIPTEGDYHWRVIGIDDDGFVIPPPYSYPIYSIQTPLAAPKLIQPHLRSPAQEAPPPKKREGARFYFQKLWHEILPQAHALPEDFVERKIIFSWHPVPGADHYIIEISSSSDFIEPEVIQKVKGESFEWSQFEKKVYYWRVAAGQDNGTKGLFSDAARVDLSKLSNLSVGELVPGVRYQETKNASKKKKSAKKHDESPLPPVFGPEPPPDVNNTPQTVGAPLKEDNHVLFNVWMGPLYQWASLDGPDGLHGDFLGFTNIYLGGMANIPLKDRGSTQLHWRYKHLAWEPRDEDKTPLQGKLEEGQFDLLIYYRQLKKPWAWGLNVRHLPTFERATEETTKLVGRWLGGPTFQWMWHGNDPWQGHHQLSLLAGEEIYGITTFNSLTYQIGNSQGIDLYVGGQLELEYLTGPIVEGPLGALAIVFGLMW